MEAYVKYRKSIQDLFPYYPSKPNYHYAMHNGKLLKFWGPLATLSEFPGEWLNGLYQKVKNSHQTSKCLIIYHSTTKIDQVINSWHGFYHGSETLSERSSASKITWKSVWKFNVSWFFWDFGIKEEIKIWSVGWEIFADILEKAKPLETYQYQGLLQYLNYNGQTWKGFNELPPPTDCTWILPPLGVMLHQVNLDEQTYICQISHEANSAIAFYNPYMAGSQITGFIEAIWQIPLHYIMQTFLVVHVHQDISRAESDLAPFLAHSRLAVKIVDVQASNTFFIIELRHVITHLTMCRWPKGTFGIQKEIISVCWSLNGGHK